jgi:hypothetical protein
MISVFYTDFLFLIALNCVKCLNSVGETAHHAEWGRLIGAGSPPKANEIFLEKSLWNPAE